MLLLTPITDRVKWRDNRRIAAVVVVMVVEGGVGGGGLGLRGRHLEGDAVQIASLLGAGSARPAVDCRAIAVVAIVPVGRTLSCCEAYGHTCMVKRWLMILIASVHGHGN